ncbi:MAG TPA: hypothetical protein VFT44_22200, partial [Pyrinomonadaceae bacterium]|nr:hypothetical protein [Pyrinomonadaceae bacterium]
MIRLILRTFLLMTFTVAAGLWSISRAQQSTTTLTGEWVGNSEPSGRSEFLRLSLTENAGEMLTPRKAKLTLVQLEGSRVRIELSSLKLVMTGTLAGDVIEGEADVPGIKARFRLMRIVKVAPETLARYVGAYRFRNGDYIVIDRFPNTQDTLWVSDVKSGQTRTIFPRSETQFTGGPALYVPSPTRQTLTFRGDGVHVIDLDHKSRQSGLFVTRTPIREEEVTFKNGDVTLSGTLLLPAAPPSSKVKRPALVFVHG